MPRVKRKGKKMLYLLGEGYPWYLDPGDKKGGTYLGLMDGPNRVEGRKRIEMKERWGAWQKVKIWIEKA